MWRKGNIFELLVGMQISAVSWSYLKKFKMALPYDSDSTSGNLSKETWNTDSKEYVHPYVHCSIIYNHQDLEAAQVSINRWEDKTTMEHLHNWEILLSHKEENFTLCNSMDGPGNVMLSEISQSEKNKNHMISLMYNLIRNWTAKQRLTHRWRAGWQLSGGGSWRWRDGKKKRTHGHGQQCGDCAERGVSGSRRS